MTPVLLLSSCVRSAKCPSAKCLSAYYPEAILSSVVVVNYVKSSFEIRTIVTFSLDQRCTTFLLLTAHYLHFYKSTAAIELTNCVIVIIVTWELRSFCSRFPCFDTRQLGRQILHFKLHLHGRIIHYRRPQVVHRCFRLSELSSFILKYLVQYPNVIIVCCCNSQDKM